MRNDSSQETGLTDAVSRREWFLLGGILLLAAILRVLMPGAFHVEHYDEGVYASNRWFTPEEGARFPDRHLYAPPLWPAILEMSQLFLGTTSLGVMLPGILCGVCSVWLTWRIAREWTGTEAALLTSAFLAVSGYHIMYSRSALTDVPVSMLILWGIHSGWRAISREHFGLAAWAGFLTGLAWSTKYNGWYPLAVIGAGLLVTNLFHVKQTGLNLDRWRCWGVMFIVAVVVWLPSWFDLQDPSRGGYAAVAANHSGYLDGWSHWLPNFRRQFENLTWWDFIGSRVDYLSLPLICLILSLYGLGIRVIGLIRSASRGEIISEQTLSGWVAVAWVSSLLLVTPLYRPYPRLALPLFMSLLIGAAFGIESITREIRTLRSADSPGSSSRSVSLAWGVVSVTLSFVLVGRPTIPGEGGAVWDKHRASAEEVATQILENCREVTGDRSSASVACVIYVYSEPAIYYQLCRYAPANVLVAPVANLGFVAQPPAREPVPIFLVTGPHAARNPEYQNQILKVEGRLTILSSIQTEVSDLVSLNLHSPSEFENWSGSFPKENYELRLVKQVREN